MKKSVDKREQRFEFEWVTVRYKTLYRWGTTLGVLAVVGIVALLVMRYSRMARIGEARNVIEMARRLSERSLRQAETDGVLEIHVKAAGILDEAERDLSQRRVAEASAKGEEAYGTFKDIVRGAFTRDRSRIVVVRGRVEVKPVGNLDWELAKEGQPLEPGDLVRTGAGSRAEILNLDGTNAKVKEESTLKIERSMKDRATGRTSLVIGLRAGKVDLKTLKDLIPGSSQKVTTPVVEANLTQDTEIGVAFNDTTSVSTFDVFRGRAELELGQGRAPVAVESLQGVKVDGARSTVRYTLPPIPEPMAPTQYQLMLLADIAKRSLDFRWRPVNGAAEYEVQIARDVLFTDKLVERSDVRGPSLDFPGREFPEGKFFWRVRARDHKGVNGGYSEPFAFTVSASEPTGEKPALNVTELHQYGEGMCYVKGRTSPGCFLAMDTGKEVFQVMVGADGEFSKLVTFDREGEHRLRIIARNSRGQEKVKDLKVLVQFL